VTCKGKNKKEKLLKLGLVMVTEQHYITWQELIPTSSPFTPPLFIALASLYHTPITIPTPPLNLVIIMSFLLLGLLVDPNLYSYAYSGCQNVAYITRHITMFVIR
jgi:hypothetical protein